MNPQLPEIVERVKPRDDDGHTLSRLCGDEYGWWDLPCFSQVADCTPYDAENACVVALLGRLKPAYGMTRDLTGWAVWDMTHKDPERVFGTSPLLALFAAFEKYPHWFAALSADERAGKEGEE